MSVKPLLLISLFCLVLHLSCHMVTCVQVAASNKTPFIRKNSHQTLHQGPRIVEERTIPTNSLVAIEDKVLSLDAIADKLAKITKTHLDKIATAETDLISIFTPTIRLRNVNSVKRATESFKPYVKERLLNHSPNYDAFLQWWSAIEHSFPGDPAKAIAIIAIVLSDELGPYDAIRVLKELPQEVSEVATTSIVTMFHYWRFKNLQLSDLLSRANFMWNNNLRNVIKTFQDPAFLVCFKYATEGDRRNENTAFLSLKEIFKANHLDNQIEDIIAAGQSALIRGEIEEKSGLPDVLEYLESQMAKEISPKLIIGEFDIQKPSENTLRDVFRKLEIACSFHKTDASKATWLLEQLSGSSYEYKLFTIMHWWQTYDDDATLPNAVLKELRLHLRKSTRSAMNRVREDSQQLLLGDNTAALNDEFGLKSIYHEWKTFMKVALQDDV